MADDTTPLGGVPPQGTAPPQATSDRANEAISSLRDSVDVMANTMSQMVNMMAEFAKATNDAQKNTDSIGDDFKVMVSFIQDIKDSMKDIIADSNKFRSNLDKKTYAQTVEQFKRLKDNSEALLKSGKANTQQAVFLERYIHRCEAALSSLNKTAMDGNKPLKDNVALFGEMKASLHNINDLWTRFSSNVGKVQIGKVSKGIMSMNALLGRTGVVEKMVRRSQEAYDIKQARDAKIKDNKSIFAEKRANVEARLAKEYPNQNINELLATNPKVRADAARELVGPEGGGISRWHVARQLAKGKGISGLEGGLVEEGAGSLAEGGIGAMEGVGAEALSGWAAPVVAAGEIMKDTFDAVATQNKKYEAALGKGGIFTGEEGGAGALRNVKNNLRAWGLNRYGITSERQLAVAQTMQESGVSIAGLARQGNGTAGSYGNIADIAFKQAREVGLTDVEGTRQTIKMMQQYKMTLDGTQTFFQTIGKDIRASGISTTKYLELIDEVTGHFDSMGKSIDTVTSILRLLGATGTSTFDQLKDNVSSLIGGEKTVEQRAFLLDNMSKASKENFGRAFESNAQGWAKQFSDALGAAITEVAPDKRDSILKGLGDLSTTEQQEEAMRRFNTAKGNAPATAATQQLDSIQMQATIARQWANAIKGGNNVNTSFLSNLIPQDATQKMMFQMNALDVAFKAGGAGSTFAKFVQNPEELNKGQNASLVSEIGKAVGLDNPKQIDNMRQAVMKMADTTVDELMSGLAPDVENQNKKQTEALYQNLLDAAGVKKEKGKTAEETAKGMNSLEQVSAFKKGFEKFFATDLSQVTGVLRPDSLINQSLTAHHMESVNQQADKIASVAESTRTTNDLLGDIKDAIVSKVGSPLLNLINFFNKSSLANADTARLTAAEQSISNPNNLMDAAFLDKVIRENKGNWHDQQGPLSGKSIMELKSGYDYLVQKITEGKAGKTNGVDDYDLLKQWTDALNAAAAHIKAGQLTGLKYNPATGDVTPVDSNASANPAANPVAGAKADAVKSDTGAAAGTAPAPSRVTVTTNIGQITGTTPTSTDSVPSGEQATKVVKPTPVTNPSPLSNGWNADFQR